MFLQLSVILFTGGGGWLPLVWGCVSATPWADTPHWADPPWQRPPPQDRHSLGRHPLGLHPLPVHVWIHTPPCALHAGMRSTSRRYASHFNAFLLPIINKDTTQNAVCS